MAKKILIIGAGGVSGVTVQKCLAYTAFAEIHLASRRLESCHKIQTLLSKPLAGIHQVDADQADELDALMQRVQPFLVIHLALPYQDLTIMEACLRNKCHYLDTANYEPRDEAKFEYSWQWKYQQKFKDAQLMALLGSGFDPGVTNVFVAYAAKHHFDEIHHLDIVDCNGGDHGQAFATNFNPEINIREITQAGKYFHNQQWHTTPPLEQKSKINYPKIGSRDSYLMYHEELESLVKHFPSIKRARFWMTFSEEYLTHLRVMQNIGITSIQPTEFQGREIIPIEFLKHLLPNPEDLSANYTGQTCIGTHIEGVKNGQQKSIFIWNNSSHELCHKDYQAQAVSFTTGVPAMIGASLICNGTWLKPGVWNMEQLDPDPFMEALNQQGLPWQLTEKSPIVITTA